MEPAGMAITSNVISAFIGKQLFSQAITDASYSIYGSLSLVFNYNNDIDDTLTKLDIKDKIKNVDTLINTIKVSNLVINKSIEGLHEIIILIREDLKQINHKIDEHKQKYWSNRRHLNCSTQLKNIFIHSHILDNRLDYLMKSLNIINFTRKNLDIENKKRISIIDKPNKPLVKLIKND